MNTPQKNVLAKIHIFSSMTSMVSGFPILDLQIRSNSYGSWAIPPASDEDLPIISRFPSFWASTLGLRMMRKSLKKTHSKVTPSIERHKKCSVPTVGREFAPLMALRIRGVVQPWLCASEPRGFGFHSEAEDLHAGCGGCGGCGVFFSNRFVRKVPQFIMVDTTTNC